MTEAPLCLLDFYGPETLADPVPVYAQMLELGPMCWLERSGVFAITHHSALTAASRQPQVFSSGRGVSIDEEVNARLIGSTLNSDPPAHGKGRAITAAPLTPRALQSVAGHVEREAKALVEAMTAKGRFDAAQDLAPVLPLRIVRDLVGLGDAGRARMLDWAAATFELMGEARERRAGALTDLAELRTFLEHHGRPEALTPGGWARRIFDLGPAAGIAPERCAELMRDYINPSLDTTIAAIGHGIKLFADNPEQWDLLRTNPDLMRNAIDEIVRLATPIRAFSRYVTQDVDLAGLRIPQGVRVLLVWGAANRDPSVFADPNRFDIARDNARVHVGFGHGIHACMGMHLARLEMSSLFAALAQRVQRFERRGPAIAGRNATINAIRSLPVEIVPA